ncbi:MAG: hypothetical protein CML67_00700 [Rhodobacteraceae bacterium]|nr:hypothetical protein [Paracoccaceae bacterium]
MLLHLKGGIGLKPGVDILQNAVEPVAGRIPFPGQAPALLGRIRDVAFQCLAFRAQCGQR